MAFGVRFRRKAGARLLRLSIEGLGFRMCLKMVARGAADVGAMSEPDLATI